MFLPSLPQTLHIHFHTCSLNFCQYQLEYSSSSWSGVHLSQVTLCTSPLGARWDLSLVITLKQRGLVGVGPEETRPCLAWQLPQGKPILRPQAMQGQFPQMGGKKANTTGGREAFSPGKDLLECRGSMSTPSSGSSHVSPFQLSRSHPLPATALL